jgi:hypothetical protein
MFYQDFQACIPTTRSGLTVITVCLKSENDMSNYSDDIENEREFLMQKVKLHNIILEIYLMTVL